jgi:N-acyl-D-aspartate/D-glutamate deacylase
MVRHFGEASDMANEHDLVLRGGTLVDGTGSEPRQADVAVSDGRITQVGTVTGSGREEIDARDRIVTPGFVDIHTHYDGQASWDQHLTPSSLHGVTTVLMGNCGVGFAPCRVEDHDRLIRLMEGVEDIPGAVLAEGLDWNWESFPDYLNALEAVPHDIDFGAQVPHGALRVYVMGERGANREPATAEDIAEMARLARQGVEAGALGFSTSRTLNHRTSDGQPTPTVNAEADELVGIANGLGAAGRGVLQMVSDLKHQEEEFAIFRRMVRESGRPMSISVAQNPRWPNAWRDTLDLIGRAAEQEGLPMRAQVCGRPVGILLGFELTMNPFSDYPSWKAIADLPVAERLKAATDPAMRDRLLAEGPEAAKGFARHVLADFDNMFVLGDAPNYEPEVGDSLGARARARGVPPQLLVWEALSAKDGRGMVYVPFLNYAGYDLDPSYRMLTDAHTIPGLGDGGAHVGLICDGSFPTSMLTLWTRDRTRGPKLPLEWVVKAQCRDTAEAVGLFDRGLVAPGMKADLNVIDYANLTLHAPEVLYDLPAGGRRLMQRASGYDATIVSGQIIRREGNATDALPGRLLRGGTAKPSDLKVAS